MSKVVFVGNVPYQMGEEQLIDIFKSVGHVVGFRLVYDRDTGKPKGYGFCEFADHETAMSAVRNLNNTDCGGRNLRIDLAESDPYLEGKTTIHGEIVDGGETRAQWRQRERRVGGSGEGHDDRVRAASDREFLKAIPQGVPLPPGTTSLDAISHRLASIDPAQLTEVLAQMKAFVINHPDQARLILVSHPQFSYGLFQALLLNRIVDPAILQRMLAATQVSTPTQSNLPPPSQQQPVPPQSMARPPQAQTIPTTIPPTSSQQIPQPNMSIPPPSSFPPFPPNLHHQQQQQQQQIQSQAIPSVPPAQHQGYYQQPGTTAAATPTPPQQHAQPIPPPPAAAAAVVPPRAAAPAPAPASSTTNTTTTPQFNLPDTIDEAQKAMLQHVLSLPVEQLQNLPPSEREAIMVMRAQFLKPSA